jgi:multisubunit Na+/H+ antiporter MnhF subunit
MASLTKKLWSLSARQRLLVLVCTTLYLVAFRPWSQTDHSIATDAYSGAAAMLVLAVLPRRTRLLYAVGFALVVALVVLFAGPAVFGVQV